MSEMTKPRGRPAQGPKSGKGAVLTTRITAETRAALEAEAERTGRSISQVAELWIDRGRDSQKIFQQMLGGSWSAMVLTQIGSAVTAIQADTPGAITHDPVAMALVYQAALEIIRKHVLGHLWHYANGFATSEGLTGQALANRRVELMAEYRRAAEKRGADVVAAAALAGFDVDGWDVEP